MELDVRAIEALIPHRYPFLMIDRVDSLTDDKIVARKMVTRNEPYFDGHYPGFPVMPGVLQVEAMAQAGALMACKVLKIDPSQTLILLMGVDKVKFRRAVVPGDQLTIEVTPLRKGASIWKLRGEAKVDGEIAAEAEFLASIQPRQPKSAQQGE
ncbi:MAG: 3-hydroxyacyl-ACP dehydratase FabZ [Myxococcales bacterium]|nr:3-hydroxyacyl-ACP dehydratase FabZ [Myxococcales bacterium]